MDASRMKSWRGVGCWSQSLRGHRRGAPHWDVACSTRVQELTSGQGGEEEGQRLALPGLGEGQAEDEDLEHELDAVLLGDAVMGKYTKVCV